MRGLLGYTLFCVGGATMAFAGGRYAIGELQRQDARRAWDEAEARAVVARMQQVAATPEHNAVPVAPGVPVARLLIPRINLDEIVLEGVDDETLNAGPGHLPGSAYPGGQGNAVVSAHRDRHFARLGEVQVGDTITTESGASGEKWVVISKRVIDADAPAIFRTREATLTLTTCWPIRFLGTAPERLLLTARPIRARQIPSFANVSAE